MGMIFWADTLHLTLRHIRVTLRLPIWIAVSLVQPVIWLALFGQLFNRVVDIPGFAQGGGGSYIEFLTPGVVIMTALFGSAWSGIGIVEDIGNGVMDRLLATPVHRGALIAARVLHAALTVAIQTVIVLVLGIALGAGLPGGGLGFVAVLMPAVLIAAAFSALSNGIALLARREETLIAIINFFGLPLSFLSASFMAHELMPGWIRTAAKANPVDWAVIAARAAMHGSEWATVWFNCGLLAVFALVTCVLATLAFHVYRRTS
jgi:ABC-2 type transport system permease protein